MLNIILVYLIASIALGLVIGKIIHTAGGDSDV